MLRPLLRQYLNRLSDVLWLLAREAETIRPDGA
jgi:cob(I)alamin adenosyltransferase